MSERGFQQEMEWTCISQSQTMKTPEQIMDEILEKHKFEQFSKALAIRTAIGIFQNEREFLEIDHYPNENKETEYCRYCKRINDLNEAIEKGRKLI